MKSYMNILERQKRQDLLRKWVDGYWHVTRWDILKAHHNYWKIQNRTLGMFVVTLIVSLSAVISIDITNIQTFRLITGWCVISIICILYLHNPGELSKKDRMVIITGLKSGNEPFDKILDIIIQHIRDRGGIYHIDNDHDLFSKYCMCNDIKLDEFGEPYIDNVDRLDYLDILPRKGLGTIPGKLYLREWLIIKQKNISKLEFEKLMFQLT